MNYDENLLPRYLFDKDYTNLNINEITMMDAYINDTASPKFKNIILDDGYDTTFKVSNTGMVIDPNGKQLKLYDDKGYQIVFLNLKYNGRRMYPKRVHRLVATAFIPNNDNLPEVNHINGNKQCNWVGNLEWCSKSDNIKHALDTGLMKTKYNPDDIHLICKLRESGMKIQDIHEITGISKSCIIGVLYRGEWKDISSQYNIISGNNYTDPDLVHSACKMMEDSVPFKDISDKLGINMGVLSAIKNGRSWMKIADKYNIPGRINTNHSEFTIADKIHDALSIGLVSTEDILKYAGLNDSPKRKSYVKYISKLRIRSKE